ncbi:hypothetical protein GCM10009069_20240 [Algimonas arctica]|uniref:Uncharacterized protein n=1 Tax=Algimonas arctica TaxID=1479486 RepID=A0A8J3G2J9_9PROT|nr:hypothetical protein GCM10009069_20240 [Algimonas arctica]
MRERSADDCVPGNTIGRADHRLDIWTPERIMLWRDDKVETGGIRAGVLDIDRKCGATGPTQCNQRRDRLSSAADNKVRLWQAEITTNRELEGRRKGGEARTMRGRMDSNIAGCAAMPRDRFRQSERLIFNAPPTI